MRSAVVEFVEGLDLHGVTLAGESMGATLSLTASVDLEPRVTRVVALNGYDYPSGLERGTPLARFIISSVRLPVVGRLSAGLEPRPVVRAVLCGGFADNAKLPEDFLSELLRSGRRPGYPRVARGVYRNLKGLNDARKRYPAVSVPVTLVYSELDWSKPAERDRVEAALPNVRRVDLPGVGHFSALETPDALARILLDTLAAARES